MNVTQPQHVVVHDGITYTLYNVLGQGAFGRVYRALGKDQMGHESTLALKFIKLIGPTDVVLESIKDVEMLQILSGNPRCNRNIPCYFTNFRGYYPFMSDSKCDPTKGCECLVIVMQFIDGQDLSKEFIAPRLRLSSTQVRKYLRTILSAVDYIHRQDIAHRDIKPANILYSRNDDDVKLIDFGLACTISQCRPGAGTPLYSPPELLTNKIYDPFKHDIWGIGSTFFEIVTLKSFYKKTDKGYVLRTPDELNKLFEDIHRADPLVSDLLRAMLDFDLSKRPTATQLLEKLNRGERCDVFGTPTSLTEMRQYLIKNKVVDTTMMDQMNFNDICNLVIDNVGCSISLSSGNKKYNKELTKKLLTSLKIKYNPDASFIELCNLLQNTLIDNMNIIRNRVLNLLLEAYILSQTAPTGTPQIVAAYENYKQILDLAREVGIDTSQILELRMFVDQRIQEYPSLRNEFENTQQINEYIRQQHYDNPVGSAIDRMKEHFTPCYTDGMTLPLRKDIVAELTKRNQLPVNNETLSKRQLCIATQQCLDVNGNPISKEDLKSFAKLLELRNVDDDHLCTTIKSLSQPQIDNLLSKELVHAFIIKNDGRFRNIRRAIRNLGVPYNKNFFEDEKAIKDLLNDKDLSYYKDVLEMLTRTGNSVIQDYNVDMEIA